MATDESAEPTGDEVTSVLRIESRHGTEGCDVEDQAAAIAVIAQVLRDEAAARHDAETGVDEWTTSASRLRTPIVPGPGAWRNFRG